LTEEEFETILVEDETINDSDKTHVVPAGHGHKIRSILVEYTTSGDAGNRVLWCEILDALGDVIWHERSLPTIAATLTRFYVFQPEVIWAQAGTFDTGGCIRLPFPNILLRAGWQVRIYDSAAIAVGADDMIIHMLVRDYVI